MKPQPKPGIAALKAYVPGKSSVDGFGRPLKLSANENPFGCSDCAREAYFAAARDLHLYPDANTSVLRAAIADKFRLEPERLVFGAGSDEIFSMVAQAYLAGGDNAVQPQYGFAAWSIIVRAAGGEMRFAAEKNFVADVQTLLANVDERTRVVFLANPANPTGTYLPFREVEQLHTRLPPEVLLVLDGAYAECAGASDFSDGLEWSRDKENVIVTRTFSKVYGLASLRIGWAYAPQAVAGVLNRIRLPFAVPRAGEAAAVAALADDAFVQRSVAQFIEGRHVLSTALARLGVTTLPSATNFVTARFDDAEAIEEGLARRGVLVRRLHTYGMPDWLRISVGTPNELERLISELTGLLDRTTPR
ncbi:MAG: histidinol-phosphate transaminase [Hyphomonadaceae bacterium]